MLRYERQWLLVLGIIFLLAASGAAEPRSSRLQRAQRPGLWELNDYQIQQTWLGEVAQHVMDHPKELHPVIAELRDLIENNTRIFLLASGMYQNIPENYTDPSELPVIRSYSQMLQVMNHLITTAPSWNQHEYEVGLVGIPMNALFDWPMGTFSGYSFFLDPQVNAILKKILNVWGEYLQSPASADVLDTSAAGWFSPQGKLASTSTANVDGSNYSFEELFVCNPQAKNHGFVSWDDFFTRQFREEKRPVAAPKNDSVIANVCESVPFAVAHNVKRRDEFWTKGQPYSIQDMLGRNDLSEEFVGGTVYQAYLSLVSYHRWHAPVNGKIVKTTKIDGTYYSEPLFEIFDNYGAAPQVPEESQGYLSVVAARAVIYIQADDPDIGLVAVVLVGMMEVSSCDITVTEGQRVNKGDEIGMFRYGGSSWLLLFRKGVKVSGFPQPGERLENVPVRSQLAVVEKDSHVDEL